MAGRNVQAPPASPTAGRTYSTRAANDRSPRTRLMPASAILGPRPPHPALPSRGEGSDGFPARRRPAILGVRPPLENRRVPAEEPSRCTDRPDPLAIILLVCAPALADDAPKAKPGEPVAASVESTLATASGKIRQFAFDGDDATYFASKDNPGAEGLLHAGPRRAGVRQVDRRPDRQARRLRRARRRDARGLRGRQGVPRTGEVPGRRGEGRAGRDGGQGDPHQAGGRRRASAGDPRDRPRLGADGRDRSRIRSSSPSTSPTRPR